MLLRDRLHGEIASLHHNHVSQLSQRLLESPQVMELQRNWMASACPLFVANHCLVEDAFFRELGLSTCATWDVLRLAKLVRLLNHHVRSSALSDSCTFALQELDRRPPIWGTRSCSTQLSCERSRCDHYTNTALELCALDKIELVPSAPFPASLLLTPNAVHAYQEMFTFQLKLGIALHSARALRIHFRRQEGKEEAASVEALLHVTHALDAMQQHILLTVRGCCDAVSPQVADDGTAC
jgi:hypothetical protein